MLGLAATCVVAAALLAAGGASAIGVREYSFLNSLRDYSGGGGTAVGVPGDGTKVPWWLGQMVARSMGRHTYAANAQFGFVDGWLNQLQGSGGPSVQLGYSNVGELGMTENSWNNFNTVNTISFVAGNFFTHLAPSERATFYAQILDLTASSGGAAGADKWLYAGWPAFDAFGASGGGVGSVTPQQYTAWRAYALGDYDTWMQGLVAAINSARPTLNPPIRLLPVNRVLVRALEGTALSALSPIDLFVDDAPHGGQTIYLLAAMVNYMAYFNEQPPASIVNADPNVNSILVNNFAAISQFMWNEFNLATSGTGTPPPPSTTGMAPPPTTTGMAPPGSAPSSPPPPPGAPSTPPSPPPPSTTGTTGFPTLSGGSNQTIVSSDSASLSAAATLAVVAAAVAH